MVDHVRSYLYSSQQLSTDDRAEWATVWQSPVTLAFASKVRELLQSVRKTEESLLKLKRKKAQEA